MTTAHDQGDRGQLVRSRKQVINACIVVYLVLAGIFLYCRHGEEVAYWKARQEAENRFAQSDTVFSKYGGRSLPLYEQPEGIQKKWYPPEPRILNRYLAPVVVIGMVLGGVWLGLQILAIWFRNVLRMAAKSVAEGRAEADQVSQSTVRK